MAGQRRINWGADATDARYRTEDTGDGANFVVAEDLDGATVLLEWDTSVTPSEWKVRGPVEMNSNDVSGVGTLTANSVETDQATVANETYVEAYLSSNTDQLSSGTFHVMTDTEDADLRGELANGSDFTPDKSGLYVLHLSGGLYDASDGDRVKVQLEDSGGARVKNSKFDTVWKSGGTNNLELTTMVDLTAGETYTPTVKDNDSSFKLNGGSGATWMKIYRSVIQQ